MNIVKLMVIIIYLIIGSALGIIIIPEIANDLGLQTSPFHIPFNIYFVFVNYSFYNDTVSSIFLAKTILPEDVCNKLTTSKLT